MKEIYDNCLCPVPDDITKELETLGDDFVRFGIAAEDGRSVDIFRELNAGLERLEEIAAFIRNGSAN